MCRDRDRERGKTLKIQASQCARYGCRHPPESGDGAQSPSDKVSLILNRENIDQKS